MTASKRSVLITGCSDGGTGAALAQAFHSAGYHVYATARNTGKMKSLEAAGIDTLALDIQSEASVAACVKLIPTLDILVNNAGAQCPMPIADLTMEQAKENFDLNVFAHIRVIQAFLPKLLESSNAMIVNHTSSASALAMPFAATYNASKAAMASYTDTLRLEMEPFHIKVVDLRSGVIKSNIFDNLRAAQSPEILPKGSVYEPAREVIEKALRQEMFEGQGIDADVWAQGVVQDIGKRSPPFHIWRGESAWLVRLSTVLPFGTFHGILRKMSSLDQVTQIIQGR